MPVRTDLLHRLKIFNEVEYMDNVVEERQENIDKINKIMNNIRDIAIDFNQEVDHQGMKLGMFLHFPRLRYLATFFHLL